MSSTIKLTQEGRELLIEILKKGYIKLSYRPGDIAAEIVDIFAKHKIAISSKDNIYRLVDALLLEQIVAPVDRESLGIKSQ